MALHLREDGFVQPVEQALQEVVQVSKHLQPNRQPHEEETIH
jgi:hypothetical protein